MNLSLKYQENNIMNTVIKKICENKVTFAYVTKINTKNLGYKLIKPLILWK